MERSEIAAYVANAIEMGSAFLDKVGYDAEVKEIYNDVIDFTESHFTLSPILQDRLETHSKIKRKELINLLEGEKISSEQETQLLELARTLSRLVEKKSDEMHSQVITQIEKVYQQQLDEAKRWSRFTIVVTSLGFLMIIVGIVASFYTGILSVGTVVTISGIVINITSALFFRQANNATKQANNTVEKLDDFRRFQLAIKMLSSIKMDANSSTRSS